MLEVVVVDHKAELLELVALEAEVTLQIVILQVLRVLLTPEVAVVVVDMVTLLMDLEVQEALE